MEAAGHVVEGMAAEAEVRIGASAVDAGLAYQETVVQREVVGSAGGSGCTETVHPEADHTEARHCFHVAAQAEDAAMVQEGLQLETADVVFELDVGAGWAREADSGAAVVLDDTAVRCTVGWEAAGTSGEVVLGAARDVAVGRPAREAAV